MSTGRPFVFLQDQTMASQHPSPEVIARIDGASRGNPGPASYGVVFESGEGARIGTLCKSIGHTTNNVAEYHGLLAALEYALEHNFRRMKVLSDSELMARQIQGAYKVKSPDLKPLYERARSAIARLESFSIEHVRREHNREADKLANKALDGAK
jgi:ribonuclease HI